MKFKGVVWNYFLITASTGAIFTAHEALRFHKHLAPFQVEKFSYMFESLYDLDKVRKAFMNNL